MAEKKTQKKGRRGQGAEGSRGGGSERDKAEHEAHEAMMMRHERDRIGKQALPFAVHSASALSPTWEDSESDSLEEYRWSAATAAIADAALLRGFQLSVPVQPDCIAFATCQIVKRLKTPVHAWYTTRHNRLLLAVMEEDQIQEDEEEA